MIAIDILFSKLFVEEYNFFAYHVISSLKGGFAASYSDFLL